MKVEVIGLGYIGLPILLSFCNKGLELIGMDNNQDKIKELQSGSLVTFEPELLELYRQYGSDVHYTNEVVSSDFYIVTVPTPYNGKADTSMVFDAIEKIIKVYRKNQIIIVESTLPPFTMDKISKLISEKLDVNYNLVYCPESILPGKILYELKTNSRIIGSNNQDAAIQVKELYQLVNTEGIFRLSNYIEAELYKLIQNAHRDVEIAFVNEVSMFCDGLDVKLEELLDFANRHPRTNLLKPGVGVGGHCIAVDPYFLIDEFNSEFLDIARKTNLRKTEYVLEKIRQHKGKTIGLLGMTYKANSDDLRESPSMYIYNTLISEGYNILACDPNLGDVKEFYNNTLDDTIATCDVFFILQKHNHFVGLDQYDKFRNI
jgi:UDP-N-acetyl-D-mannosaminuronic acid dehydrogenase